MGKKILFAVMALLVMATGKIWAQDTAEKTPYAVLCSNGTDDNTYTMYFVYTSEAVTTGDTGGNIDFRFQVSDGSYSENITYTKAWEVKLNADSPDWQSDTNGLTTDEKAKITKVMFEDTFKDVKVTSCNKWFSDFTGLTRIVDIKYLDTSEVENMSSMFNSCNKLESLDLSSFNTSNVTNMESMFSDCGSLTKLNLSSFNTSMVTKMRNMFNGCSKLNYLTLGCFDMTQEKSVNNKNDMFDNSNITIRGNNVLVFVKSDAQKGVWEGFTGVNLMVKKNGEDKYVSNGTVEITLDNDKDTPVIFPYNFTANSVTFTRTFTAGKPHTVCLPFAIKNTAAYGTFYELSGYDNGKVKFKKVDKTNGNTPYLFIPNTDGITTINVTGNVDISSTRGGGNAIADDNNTRFRGVYEKFTFTEEYLNSSYDNYGWTSNTDGNGYFRKAGAGASVAPCRAYIRLAKGGAGIGSAPARLSVEFDDGETTGIDTIGTAVSGANGGADAPMYNLQGQRVSGGYKGVVIKNGKKMIVK